MGGRGLDNWCGPWREGTYLRTGRARKEAMVDSTVRRPGRRVLDLGSSPVLAASLSMSLVPGAVSAAAGPAWVASTAPTAGLNPVPVAPSGDGAILSAVACPAAGSCLAIGHYVASSQL